MKDTLRSSLMRVVQNVEGVVQVRAAVTAFGLAQPLALINSHIRALVLVGEFAQARTVARDIRRLGLDADLSTMDRLVEIYAGMRQVPSAIGVLRAVAMAHTASVASVYQRAVSLVAATNTGSVASELLLDLYRGMRAINLPVGTIRQLGMMTLIGAIAAQVADLAPFFALMSAETAGVSADVILSQAALTLFNTLDFEQFCRFVGACLQRQLELSPFVFRCLAHALDALGELDEMLVRPSAICSRHGLIAESIHVRAVIIYGQAVLRRDTQRALQVRFAARRCGQAARSHNRLQHYGSHPAQASPVMLMAADSVVARLLAEHPPKDVFALLSAAKVGGRDPYILRALAIRLAQRNQQGLVRMALLVVVRWAAHSSHT
jgi:hypothetical protein